MKHYLSLLSVFFCIISFCAYFKAYGYSLSGKSLKDSTLAAPALVSPVAGATFEFNDGKLVWNRVPGAVSYRIQVASDSSKFVMIMVDVPNVKDTLLDIQTYISTKLRAGTKYYWRVSASDSTTTGAFSDVWSFVTKYTFSKTIRDAFNSTFDWFTNNPPSANGSNFNDRWNKTAILDTYGFQLSNSSWNSYRSYWTSSPSAADAMEYSNPILYFLNMADEHAFDEIRNTTVNHGVIIWEIYNMGIIVKTKNTCFATDIVARGSAALADIIDFAVISHSHSDHKDQPFIDALVAKGKPVYAPFTGNGITVISDTKEFNIGEVNVRFTMNDQGAGMPVIVTQINFGTSANNYTLYNMADARDLSALSPTRPIDVLMLHIANGYDPIDAVTKVKPKKTIYSHMMELGHSTASDGYRWKWDYTYNKIKSQPHASILIPVWGEKIVVDSTLTAVEDKEIKMPGDIRLNQNYPNPFNPETTISYQLPFSGKVTLKIYDQLGRDIKTLVSEYQSAGDHAIKFDAGDLSSSIYFCRITSGDRSKTMKMILQK